jgi:hypothetical protein
MVLALLGVLAAVMPARGFSEERLLLDRRLETLRRILPDGANPASDTALVKEIVDAARLAAADVVARPPTESGARGDVVVDLTGQGRFGEIDRLFRQIALSSRLIDVESLSLTATPADLVRLVAVLRIPYRPLKSPLPAPPDGARDAVNGVPRPMADAFLRDQALALAKAETIATLRRSRRNPRLFLSEVAAVVRDRPVVLGYASLGEEFVIRGIGVGEGPMRALESRFERGFFRVSEFLMARQGACHRFEVRGRSPVVGSEAELPLPTEDPFRQDDSPCRIDRDPGRSSVVRGPAGKNASKGPLSLRLRDVDLADAFFVLHLLTSQAFVVDADVSGRVSADLSRVTLEEAIAAFEKLGVKVGAPGPIRRVAAARNGVPRAPASSGGSPTGTFTLKRAEVRDVLAVMTEADATLGALGPQDSLGRVSVWARDVPLADVRAAVLDSAGLSERWEEGRRLLERASGSDDPLVPVAGAAPERRLLLRPQDLTVLEFQAAGLAGGGDGWTALAYAPTGVLNVYRSGDRLADAVVKAVESTDVLLETDEGPLRLTLPLLPR